MIAQFIRGALNSLRRSKARVRYEQARTAHWDAVDRGDTRAMHDTAWALREAAHDCLRFGA